MRLRAFSEHQHMGNGAEPESWRRHDAGELEEKLNARWSERDVVICAGRLLTPFPNNPRCNSTPYRHDPLQAGSRCGAACARGHLSTSFCDTGGAGKSAGYLCRVCQLCPRQGRLRVPNDDTTWSIPGQRHPCRRRPVRRKDQQKSATAGAPARSPRSRDTAHPPPARNRVRVRRPPRLR